MEKVLGFIGGIALVCVIWGGVMWCIWLLWCWVLPQVYEGGPEKLLSPGFWLFAACWTLLSLGGKTIFGNRKK